MHMTAHTTRNQRRYRGVLYRCCLLLASSTACIAAVPINQPQAGSTENYTSPDQAFTIVSPKDWTKDEKGHPYGDLTAIAGVRLTGPMGSSGVPVAISVLHYRGEGLFKSPEEFIQHKLNSIGRIDSDQKVALTDIKVAKRPGQTFQIKTVKLVYLRHPVMPPMREGVVYELAPPYIKVNQLEHYLVLPAGKGFFVLSYCAPELMFEEYKPVFDRLVGSFCPRLP